MNSILKTTIVGPSLVSALLLSACTQHVFVDAYDFRNKAAMEIGLQEATPTVWNEDTTLQLGRIYQNFGSKRNGYALTSYSGLFVKSINDPIVSTVLPDHTTWSDDISDNDKINLQLGYMGLSAQLGANVVKKISFSLDSDTKGGVMEFDRLQTILNDPDNGPTLRASILEDSHRIFDNRMDRQNARFWIILEVHMAKNLTMTLSGDNSLTAKLDTSDAATLANWVKVPNLTFPTFDVEPDHTTSVTFKAPDTFGWVAMCVPLFADLDGPSKGQIYPDQTTIRWAANSLHH